MRAKLLAFGRNTFSSLSRRNFRLYFAGQSISLTGGWMQGVALSWLVLHLTGSAAALGIISALQYAPTLLLGPFAGVLVDRFPTRRVLYVTQTLSAIISLALGIAVATGVVQAWMVYGVAALFGLVSAIDYPTRQSFVFELTGPREVASAVGLTGTVANLARVAGPAVAGVLIASVGLAACFIVNAVSFVAVLVCLSLMRTSEFHQSPSLERSDGGLAEAFAYVRRTPSVRAALAITTVVSVLTFEFSVTLPAFAKFTLGTGAAGLATLMSAMGAGAAVGGLVTAGRRGDGIGRLAVGSLAFGVFTALVGASPTLEVASLSMFFAGVFSARFTGISNQILQLQTDPALRNRIVALWSTAFIGSALFGAPLVGWIAASASPRWALGVGLVGGVLAGLIGWVSTRHELEPARPALVALTPVRERAA